MKIFLALAFLAAVATIAIVTTDVKLPKLHPQKSFSRQPEQPFPQPQQQLFREEQSTLKQQPFPAQQLPFEQQQFSQKPPYPQLQQPAYPQPEQQPNPHQQQPFPQQHEQLVQEQQPFVQQQLIPCRDVLQRCIPVAPVSFLHTQMVKQRRCQVLRQQCCQQLSHIPNQSQCHAIHSVVHTIILQQHQQQLGEGTLAQPQRSMQPQQHQLDQGWVDTIRTWVLQTLPTMCDLHVAPYCSTITSPQ
ncbi:hypothetical protein ZWY2020_005782 [Hordeum vulgare]|nr:hypothetical protein ZWY2020_005782 [Hordeum vulgare]